MGVLQTRRGEFFFFPLAIETNLEKKKKKKKKKGRKKLRMN